MRGIEKKALALVQKKSWLLLLAGGIVLRFLICYYVRSYESGDFWHDLRPWFQKIAREGGLRALSEQVGNYNIPYQFLIALMTYIPANPLYLYKGLSIFFDFLMAFAGAKLVASLTKNQSKMLFSLSFTAILMLPVTILDSAVWAQCDSIYVSFILLSIWQATERKYHRAFLLLGAAFAFKLQAIFIFPFFVFLYLLTQKFSILYFFDSLLSFYALCIPGVIARRDWLAPFRIYFDQAGSQREMWANFSSFWVLVGDDYALLREAGVLITAFLLLAALCLLLHRKWLPQSGADYLALAAWTSWTCVLFLPAMHERYGYLVNILLLLLVLIKKEYVFIALADQTVTLLRYRQYLFSPLAEEANIGITAEAMLYTLAWAAFTYCFVKHIRQGKNPQENDVTPAVQANGRGQNAR